MSDFDPARFAAEVEARLREVNPKLRRYASHWQWPNKGVKERGIAGDLLKSLTREGAGFFQDHRSSPKDPPDVLASGLKGHRNRISRAECPFRRARLIPVTTYN